jgi:hypothetical protein
MGMNWEDALAYIEQKNAENYLGYSDWRLPDAKELQSLVDYARSPDTTDSAAIDPLFNVTSITNEAGETDYPYYWSSTTHARVDGSGTSAVYVAFGRSLGTMDEVNVIDVHGAGAQRSDPKDGDPVDYPAFHGPQGDVQRVFNYVRLVRDAEVEETPTPTETPTEGPTDGPTETPTETPLPSPEGEEKLYLPLILNTDAGDASDTGGYTLFAPLNETTTYLIDEEGETDFTWESDYRPGNAVYLLENGNLLHTGNTQSDSGIS